MPDDRKEIDVFDDLMEGHRTLTIEINHGTIYFKLKGGRPISRETFRLGSEEVEGFCQALRAARAEVPRPWLKTVRLKEDAPKKEPGDMVFHEEIEEDKK